MAIWLENLIENPILLSKLVVKNRKCRECRGGLDYPTQDTGMCDDCYYGEFGEELDKHPVRFTNPNTHTDSWMIKYHKLMSETIRYREALQEISIAPFTSPEWYKNRAKEALTLHKSLTDTSNSIINKS